MCRLNALVNGVIPYIPVIGFLFMYFMSCFFQPNIAFFRLFDKLLSGRLKLGNKALEDYGITLFGQTVPMNGNGGSLISLGDNYFLLTVLICLFFVAMEFYFCF